jgi:hypothetical protein
MSKELLETLEHYKELEDQRIADFLFKHNNILRGINEVNLSGATPYQLAELEYRYSQVQLYANLIASHYRKLQRYHESRSDQDYADSYETIRDTKEPKRSAADAQVMARKAKGKQMEEAGKHEADFLRWSGIAKSYELSCYSLKDMQKGIEKEGG